jgi:hypothetical protein
MRFGRTAAKGPDAPETKNSPPGGGFRQPTVLRNRAPQWKTPPFGGFDRYSPNMGVFRRF